MSVTTLRTDTADHRTKREHLQDFWDDWHPTATPGSLVTLAGTAAVVGGASATALNFTPSSPWLFFGLILAQVGATFLVAGLLLSARTRIVRAFDIGFESGFKAGIKNSADVIHMDV